MRTIQTLCLLILALTTFAQSGISIERNEGAGSERMLLTTHNLNDGNLADNEFRIQTGTGDNLVTSWLLNYAKSYTGVDQYAGYFTLSNDTKGIILRGEKPESDIRFVLGGFPIADHQKMILNQEGNLGIGAFDPNSRLQIKDRDIYLQDVGSGVIMTSPDGSCWRMSIDDMGTPNFTKLDNCSRNYEDLLLNSIINSTLDTTLRYNFAFTT